jgi:uncharacterized protein (DUF983 family)
VPAARNPRLAGLAGRRPPGGEGRLFDGVLKASLRCEACGFDLARANPGDGPAVFLMRAAS